MKSVQSTLLYLRQAVPYRLRPFLVALSQSLIKKPGDRALVPKLVPSMPEPGSVYSALRGRHLTV